mmetsp:Transcript_16832/g.46429  ORF Transcript_16832/g.46429 Transcript_16832/m.46429 type:complete len:203 (-) Transcript_16832:2162-2770(-)
MTPPCSLQHARSRQLPPHLKEGQPHCACPPCTLQCHSSSTHRRVAPSLLAHAPGGLDEQRAALHGSPLVLHKAEHPWAKEDLGAPHLVLTGLQAKLVHQFAARLKRIPLQHLLPALNTLCCSQQGRLLLWGQQDGVALCKCLVPVSGGKPCASYACNLQHSAAPQLVQNHRALKVTWFQLVIGLDAAYKMQACGIQLNDELF